MSECPKPSPGLAAPQRFSEIRGKNSRIDVSVRGISSKPLSIEDPFVVDTLGERGSSRSVQGSTMVLERETPPDVSFAIWDEQVVTDSPESPALAADVLDEATDALLTAIVTVTRQWQPLTPADDTAAVEYKGGILDGGDFLHVQVTPHDARIQWEYNDPTIQAPRITKVLIATKGTEGAESSAIQVVTWPKGISEETKIYENTKEAVDMATTCAERLQAVNLFYR